VSATALPTFEDVKRREAEHFLPVVNRIQVAIVSGAGSRVTDVNGKSYIDLTAGWGVTAIGHCHPALVKAISDQAGTLMQTTNLFYTLPQLDLIEALDRITPPAITRSFLTNSGTEAVEGAIKLSHRATGRSKFVAAANSFHGRTLGALSLIGQQKHREAFEPLLNKTTIVPFGDLDAAVSAIDESTAAIIVEPVQGEGGVNVAPEGYLRGLAAACREQGALLILDEIQTGIGRTGTWLALEHDQVTPDILTLGKGLGGGFPVACFMCTEAVGQTASPGEHGGTYIGNPVAAVAASTVLRVMEEEKVVANSARLGQALSDRLAGFVREHTDLASETRGRGLLQALVLRHIERAATIPARAAEKGVLVNVTAGNVVRFFPPLNIPDDELFDATEIVFDLVREG
jgi:acetylornithine/N-succinyldiaminopimelate aminotransferase